MTIDAVIFDCDGTLVDSLLLTTEVLVAYLADLGIALSASDVAARFGDGKLATSIVEFERFVGTCASCSASTMFGDSSLGLADSALRVTSRSRTLGTRS
jgi:phosphoglycolate phosphatase-like HAD superfamily hydrolase